YVMSPQELNAYLRNQYAPVYKLAQKSLDSISELGYNTHSDEHIDRVTDATHYLLKAGGYSESVQRRGIAAARAHDLGNLISRELHSIISPWMLARIVPGFLRDTEQWINIKRAILYHDSSVAEAILASWGSRTDEDPIDSMRRFGPEALALIIADKVQIGRHRISEKTKNGANGGSAVDLDQHVEANLLGETKGIRLSNTKRTLIWDINFTPDISGEDLKIFEHLATKRNSHKGYKATISGQTDALRKNDLLSISHFSTWESLFWKLYLDRVKTMNLAAFALYPKLDTITISMHDNLVEDGQSNRTSTYSIYRKEVDQFIQKMQKIYEIKKKQ
ncbi:MAG: hypothetical protein Q7S38_00210, partial [bacterium]|nr:hypothetical protein [bacterium]